MADRGYIWPPTRIAAFYLGVAITVLLPTHANAKAKIATPQNPVNPANPLGLPIGVSPNYARPVREAVGPRIVTKDLFANPCSDAALLCDLPAWSFTLSESYQFLNDRSRTGGLSLNDNSAITDLTVAANRCPWTCLDFSYMYSHFSGSSPTGAQETGNQNGGSLRVLQPIPLGKCWVPAALSTKPLNYQLGLILSANYGDAITSTTIPQSPSIRGSERTFVGNALLDFQFDWFRNRTARGKERDTYPGLFLELSSGFQYSTTRLHSTEQFFSAASTGQQLTYQNICCLTYSFSCGFGFLGAVEWDAPLHSTPLAGTQPFYANTATFTGGLVYNIYAYRTAEETAQKWPLKALSHWSAALIYSYTAFNPLTETNQLQVQLSYTF
jgi:hypothetical protein